MINTSKIVYNFLLWFTWVVIGILSTSLLIAEEGEPVIFFDRSIHYWNWFPSIVDPLENNDFKTLPLQSEMQLKHIHGINAFKKITKLKKGHELGLIENTFIMYQKIDDENMLIPSIITFDWYKNQSFTDNQIVQFRKKIIQHYTRRRNSQSTHQGSSISLINKQIGNTNVKLNIKGNISINGSLIFEDKDNIALNSQENKSWDLDVNQTQKFNIEGIIGEKLKIKVDQDSESDFAWENNLLLEYDGDDNDIIQNIVAGNISLNLPSTQFVSVGSGKHEGLFGIKMTNQLGPLSIQTIVSREQVRKSGRSMAGGEMSDETSINDYNFIKDRYYFIDDDFKRNFYPLSTDYRHTFDINHVIGEYEIFKRVTGYNSLEVGIYNGVAYLDPLDSTSFNDDGSWIKLVEGIDYDIEPFLGYIRLNTPGSNDVVGIHYQIATYEPDSLEQFIVSDAPEDSTGTNIDYVYNQGEYDICMNTNGCDSDSLEIDIDYQDIDGDGEYTPPPPIKLKLIKTQGTSTPNSVTWPLMFKNVYSLGGSGIDLNSLEVEIVHAGGALGTETHSDAGNSFLSIFGLDKLDVNGIEIPNGDGKIDLHGSLISQKYGELFLPFYLPFAYDNPDDANAEIWGNNHSDISEIIEADYNDIDNSFDNVDSGPAMYYSNTQQDITEEHEFKIVIKSSSRSSTMNLGFMIVEGSEQVTLNGRTLVKNVDYTIDYFSGTLNFLIPDALDPTANIQVSYEENELVSFDQKLLTGTHFKYEINDDSFLSGGLYYYNQSIADEKVDIGFEPMQNLIWNMSGKYENELNFLTTAVDKLPFIETTEPSRFKIEGEVAQVYPNPNPLDQAFLDDFESSKRSSTPSILQRQWKLASPPVTDTLGTFTSILNRGNLAWYNPYVDVQTTDIWPNMDVSSQANNTTTKTLWLETFFDGEGPQWNGITTSLFSSDYDQSRSKFMDIWVNVEDVNYDFLSIHIDLGYISEDINLNGDLDTEDQMSVGGQMGNGILEEGEDTGLDGCEDEYEDGDGGCSDTQLNDGGVDPNQDNWVYDNSNENYQYINGTEGNSQAQGYLYPDTEDLNGDMSLDNINGYFTYSFKPKNEGLDIIEGDATNDWKLFRIPLSEFKQRGDIIGEDYRSWEEIRTFRLWVESESHSIDQTNIVKIAKIEIVGNEWQEMGMTSLENLPDPDDEIFVPDSTFTIEVINSQENSDYESPPGIVDEVDEVTGTIQREQSIVLSFEDDFKGKGGIASESVIAIEKNFGYSSFSNDKKNSFFAYNNMEMFVFGDGDSWLESDTSEVELLFRFGKDDDYYEIHQPIYNEWDERNHVNLNLDELTRYKLNIGSVEELADTGIDGVFDEYESGCFEKANPNIPDALIALGYTYETLWDSCEVHYNLEDFGEFADITVCENGSIIETHELYGFPFTICRDDCWVEENPIDCYYDDPNGDNWIDINEDEIWNVGEGTEENNIQDCIVVSDISTCEGPIDDLNENGFYDNPSEYKPDYDYWVWEDDINTACNNCTELRVKGEPAINRIEYIMVGVINNSDNTVFGRIFLDELRMTGVKHDKGQAMRVSGSIEFADLLKINSSYSLEDADFHRLQERLGTGNTSNSFSISTNFYPHKFLPSQWGINTPITVNYSSNISSPKFKPGTDILLGDIADTPDSLKSISQSISFSTGFNKTSRSDNWLMQYTVDKIDVDFSTKKTTKSTTTIKHEEIVDSDFSANYQINFNKDNYISPFKSTEDIPLIGKSLSETRWYYLPEKVKATIKIDDHDKISYQRGINGTVTQDTSMGMTRTFLLNYKLTESLQSNYNNSSSSNLSEYISDKFGFIKDMNPGVIKSLTENFSNTFSPNFMDWLKPKFTYNPKYTWSLVNQTDSIPSANVSNNSKFSASFNFSPKELVELVYKPENASGSSRSSSRRGRRKTSMQQEEKQKRLEIKNPTLKAIFNVLHTVSSKVSKVNFSYNINSTHSQNNIFADMKPSYWYRLGLWSEPFKDVNYYNLGDEDNQLVGSYSHSNTTDYKISTSINLTSKLTLTNMEYKNSVTTNLSSSSDPTVNISETFLPLGLTGNDGIPILGWSVNLSGLEKYGFFKNWLKSLNFSHSYKGERSESFKNGEQEKLDFSRNFSPLFGMVAKTKGRNPVTFKLTYNMNLNINNTGTQTERIYKNQLTGSIDYKKSDGFTLPIFFFRDFVIDNEINFRLDVSYDKNYTLFSYVTASDISEFDLSSFSNTIGIKPRINYSFTRYVDGDVYFNYIITDNNSVGKKTEKNFGFTVKIKIQG